MAIASAFDRPAKPQGIIGASKRPFGRVPLCNVVTICSLVQWPIAVSLSGVIPANAPRPAISKATSAGYGGWAKRRAPVNAAADRENPNPKSSGRGRLVAHDSSLIVDQTIKRLLHDRHALFHHGADDACGRIW
jgi:hypothetical protein